MTVSVILLAHNEAASIAAELRAFHREVVERIPGGELIVAEDGSRDGTRERIAELAREIPLRLVGGPKRLGYRNAMLGAISASDRPWIFFCDAGRKHDPADFWRLYELREQYDLIVGRKAHRTDQWHRRLLSWGLNLFLRHYFGAPVRDADSGMRLLNRRAVAAVMAHPLIFRECSGSEIVIRAIAANLRYAEVPVSYAQRDGKSSGMPARKIPRAIGWLLSDARQLRRQLRSSA